MRHSRSHHKTSIRGRPSSQSPLSTRSYRVLRRKFISPRIRITPMINALNQALVELDATEADANVENNIPLSDSPRENLGHYLGDAVVQRHNDEDARDGEVGMLLVAIPSSSSSLVRPSLSPPRTCMDDAPLVQDGSPEVPSPPSYPLHDHYARPSETRGGGAASAVARHGLVAVKSEEDQDDEMPPPSPVAAEPFSEPVIPLRPYKEKQAFVTFPGKEVDEERMYTIFNYVVDPDPQKHEGDIALLWTANPFDGVTNLTLSFKCPGSRDEDEDRRQERRRGAIIEALHWLGAVLGHSLRGLDVTAPWPELSFPCVPGVLEIILGNFPVLGNLRFGDLQCECAGCERVYSDAASFRRLHVAALERQVSGPLTADRLQTVVIGRKSMHSLSKDFMVYVGNAERLANEALFGTCTVTMGEDPAGATARSQREALFFAQLLKRHLPSVLHFLVVTRELRVMYNAPSSPTESSSADSERSSKSPQAELERDTPDSTTQSSIEPRTPIYRGSSVASSCTCSTSGCTPPDCTVTTSVDDPSFDLSGDISLEDDLCDESPSVLDIDHVHESPPRNAFAQARDDHPPDIQTQGSSDADPTLASGTQDVIIASDWDWRRGLMLTAEDDGLGTSPGSPDIGIVPSLVSFPAARSSPAESLFGDREFYSGSSSSPLDDPGQRWIGNVDRDEIHIPLEDTANVQYPRPPPGWLQHDDSAVTMSDEFRLDAASYGGPMWSCCDDAGLTDLATTMLSGSDDRAHSASVDHSPAYGYPEALGYDYGMDPAGSDWVSLDGKVERLGENGEPGLWGDMDMFVS